MTTRDPLTPADKEALSAAPPGTQTIELLSVYPRPGALVGQHGAREGFVRQDRPAGLRINVTSMELVHLKCGQ